MATNTAVLMSLGGLPLRANPNDIRWNFKMKTVETKTIGGKVIQIIGTTLSDLTLRGEFGRGRRDKGDKEGWEQQIRFRSQVHAWASRVETKGHPKSIRLVYPPRNWDFEVYIKDFLEINMEVTEINPKWQLVLFPVDDNARKVISGIKDLYIQRLMDGVGWKQSAYNGPSQDEVDQTLSGRSVEEYLAQRTQDAYNGVWRDPDTTAGESINQDGGTDNTDTGTGAARDDVGGGSTDTGGTTGGTTGAGQ